MNEKTQLVKDFEESIMNLLVTLSDNGVQAIVLNPQAFKDLRDQVKGYVPSSASALVFQGPTGAIRIIEGT